MDHVWDTCMKLVRQCLNLLMLLLFALGSSLEGSKAVQDMHPERLLSKYSVKKVDCKVGVLSIDDAQGISNLTALYVQQALQRYVDAEIDILLVYLNTPGGALDAAVDISKEINSQCKKHGITSVAYIDNWAVSAGALIAYNSEIIVASSSAIMGAAAPVRAPSGAPIGIPESGTENKEAAQQNDQISNQKILSVVSAHFAAAAGIYGRNELVARAMVDKELTVVVRNKSILSLESNAEIKSTDLVLTKQGKLLTLTSKQLVELGIAKKIINFITAENLLNEALDKGSEDNTQYEFIAYSNWKLSFFRVLASSAVTMILLVSFLVFAYLELSSPGFGVFGTLSAVSLALICLSMSYAQVISYLEICFILFGIGLLLLEILVIPGFGIPGLLGLLSLLIGIFCLLMPQQPLDFAMEHTTFLQNVSTATVKLAIVLSASFLITAILYKFIVSFRAKIPFVNIDVSSSHQERFLPELGSKGVAVSTLRPYGMVSFNQRVLEAMTRGGPHIAPGTSVVVVSTSNGTVEVKEAKPPSTKG